MPYNGLVNVFIKQHNIHGGLTGGLTGNIYRGHTGPFSNSSYVWCPTAVPNCLSYIQLISQMPITFTKSLIKPALTQAFSWISRQNEHTQTFSDDQYTAKMFPYPMVALALVIYSYLCCPTPKFAVNSASPC